MKDPFPDRPFWAHFRWHAVPAVIGGFLLAGFDLMKLEYLTQLHNFIGLSSYMEWGPWVSPFNSALILGVPVVVMLLHLIKYSNLRLFRTFSYWQIGIWWTLWVLFGVAYRFGEYIGP